MSQIARSWLAFAAIGAAVIHLALVISSPLPLAVALGVLGAAEAAWGVLVLVKDRVVVPRIARAGTIGPVILWSLLIVAAILLNATFLVSSLTFIPMAVATLFELFIAAVVSTQLRRQAGPDAAPTPRKTPSAALYLVGLFAGGLVVAALTTPALTFTQAGGATQSADGTYQFHVPEHHH